ncbi:MAG: hypothetical protein EPN45_09545 [Rhizobiaceae bacterium]|nr:MAG: hypothetical protein EPN45_09545 [Rhizobiaceae bacterium]
MLHVAEATGQDIDASFGHVFSRLYAAGHAAISAIASELAKLGADISSTTGNLTIGENTKAAFDALVQDAATAGAKVKAAMAGIGKVVWSDDAEKDYQAMLSRMSARASEWKSAQEDVFRDFWNESQTIWGAGTKAVEATEAQHQTHMGSLNDQGAKQAARAAMEGIQEEIRATQDGLKQKEQLYAFEVQTHQITKQQEIAQERDAVNQEYEAELQLLQKELQIGNLSVTQKQAVDNKIVELQRRRNDQLTKLDQQAALETEKTWQSALNSLTSAFNGQLDGLLKGTTSWRQAMGNIFASLTEDIIKRIETWVENWILGEVATTTAHTTANAEKMASDTATAAAGNAVATTSFLGKIAQDAAEVFAGIFAFLSPILGPAAVGPAAAGQASVMAQGAAAALPKLNVGTWGLQSDMPIMAHQGEMVVPAFESGKIRNLADAASTGIEGTSGGGIGSLTVQVAVNGSIAKSDVKKLGRHIAIEVAQQWKMNPRIRPVY